MKNPIDDTTRISNSRGQKQATQLETMQPEIFMHPFLHDVLRASSR